MKSLVNFLQLGVTWAGIVRATTGCQEPQVAADLFENRAVKAVLLHMASRLNASRASAGLSLSRPHLSNSLYQKSTVSAVLAQLTLAGVVKRVRGGRKGCVHEEVARTIFNPTLLDLAMRWQSQHQANIQSGRRGAAALPARCTVNTPLIWTDPPANVEPMRVSKGQRPNIGVVSVQNLDTAIKHTAPAPGCFFNSLKGTRGGTRAAGGPGTGPVTLSTEGRPVGRSADRPSPVDKVSGGSLRGASA